MNHELHATTSSDSVGQPKPAGLVFPPEVRARLNAKLAQVSVAQNDTERLVALKGYRSELELARAEDRRRMELVEFRGDKIHRFELAALHELVDQINEQYARQRAADPAFDVEDIDFKFLALDIRENSVESIYLPSKKLTEIPPSINKLINLRMLILSNNNISEIKNLGALVNLQTLKLDKNQISEIKNLDALVNLQRLVLDKNQISEIKNLDALVNLRMLQLGENQITEVKNLDALVGLKDVLLHNNKIDEKKSSQEIADLRKRIGRYNVLL